MRQWHAGELTALIVEGSEMRAMMSIPNGGHRLKSEYNMNYAAQEARAILAETEPRQVNRMLGPGYWSAFEIGKRYPNTSPCSDFGDALAESLERFIAEGV